MVVWAVPQNAQDGKKYSKPIVSAQSANNMLAVGGWGVLHLQNPVFQLPWFQSWQVYPAQSQHWTFGRIFVEQAQKLDPNDSKRMKGWIQSLAPHRLPIIVQHCSLAQWLAVSNYELPSFCESLKSGSQIYTLPVEPYILAPDVSATFCALLMS